MITRSAALLVSPFGKHAYLLGIREWMCERPRFRHKHGEEFRKESVDTDSMAQELKAQVSCVQEGACSPLCTLLLPVTRIPESSPKVTVRGSCRLPLSTFMGARNL